MSNSQYQSDELPLQSDALCEDESFTRFILAAEQCFRQYGIERTRMSDVAREAGLPRPYLYRYVSSKDELIVRVMSLQVDRLDADRRQQLPLEGPVGVLILKSIVMGVSFMIDNVIAREFITLDTGKLASRLSFVDVGDLPSPRYWGPIFDYGRTRGELRTDLNDKDLLRWTGALETMFTQLLDLHSEKGVGFYVENFVLPGLLTEQGLANMKQTE